MGQATVAAITRNSEARTATGYLAPLSEAFRPFLSCHRMDNSSAALLFLLPHCS